MALASGTVLGHWVISWRTVGLEGLIPDSPAFVTIKGCSYLKIASTQKFFLMSLFRTLPPPTQAYLQPDDMYEANGFYPPPRMVHPPTEWDCSEALLGPGKDLQQSYPDPLHYPPTTTSCCGCVWSCPCQCHPRAASEPFLLDTFLQCLQWLASFPQPEVFPATVIPPPTPPMPVSSVDSPDLSACSVPAATAAASIEQLNGVPNAGREVPQTFHIAVGTSKRFGLQGLPDYIDFRRSNGNGKGVLLSDMQIKDFSDLAKADEVMLERHGCQIMLHVNWPGYKEWKKPLRTRVQRDKAYAAASRGAIAHRVALCMQQFIKDQENEQQPEQWAVGKGAIGLNDILLLRLVQITRGAWRAEFAVV
ncbi:hypothetical protein EVG20_g8378 [Dentipellis fragilis]|uniref:Uncharacterized protein n=1 Tax=Dentipellis fragilis TaxID=205917 RepID=A0A4Y9Y696_9AGAM|nr:hypothetical protein EVG20_g8378 [Dentipellis fragilis]